MTREELLEKWSSGTDTDSAIINRTTVFRECFPDMIRTVTPETEPTIAWEVLRIVRSWLFSRRAMFCGLLKAMLSERSGSRYILGMDAALWLMEPGDVILAACLVKCEE